MFLPYFVYISFMILVTLEDCSLHALLHNLGVKPITQASRHIVWNLVWVLSKGVSGWHWNTQTHTHCEVSSNSVISWIVFRSIVISLIFFYFSPAVNRHYNALPTLHNFYRKIYMKLLLRRWSKKKWKFLWEDAFSRKENLENPEASLI